MNENHKLNSNENIAPYLEALSFFDYIQEIRDKFSNEKYKSIDFFKEKLSSKQKYDFESSPQKIFYFFLDELHKLFKVNNEENKGIKAVEYNKEAAIQNFNDFRKNDITIINDLFFGNKLIIKNCRTCNMTQYDCKYLKVIPLNIKNLSGQLYLEELISSISNNYSKNLFCQMCSDTKEFLLRTNPNLNPNFNLNFRPKILIIVIFNYQPKTRVDIPSKILNNSYKLISAEIEYYNKSLFSYASNCCKIKKCHKLFYIKKSSKIHYYKKQKVLINNKLPKGNPYVLFYEKVSNYSEEANETDINQTQNDKTNSNINSEKNYNNCQLELNNKNPIGNKLINPTNSLARNIRSIELQSDPNSRDKLASNIKKITLIFQFENEKELYLDIEDCLPFRNIIAKLVDEYKLDKNEINENQLYYCNNKIKYNETPKDLGINEEKAYIYVR